jgi:hypothetical protein
MLVMIVQMDEGKECSLAMDVAGEYILLASSW